MKKESSEKLTLQKALKKAENLLDLTCQQGLSKAKKIVGQLEELSGTFFDSEEIAFMYIEGLHNLPYRCQQEGKALLKTADKAEMVVNRFIDNKDIALVFLKIIGFVSCFTDKKELRKEMLLKVEEIYKQFNCDESIAKLYSKELFSSAIIEDIVNVRKIIEKLEKLLKVHENSEIGLNYAYTLSNYFYMQDNDEKEAAVKKLEQLASEFSEDDVINMVYMNRLSATINKNNAEKVLKIVRGIKKKFSENQVIVYSYAKILLDTMGILSEEKVIENLTKLSEDNKKYGDIALCLANALLKVYPKQSADDKKRIFTKVQKIVSKKYSQSSPFFGEDLWRLNCWLEEEK